MTSKPRIVIVGAGPAGMMLAYQLVSNGIDVEVIERHPDFAREFRGELMMPSVLGPLEDFGILPALLATGSARFPVERRLFVGNERRVVAPGGPQIGAWVSQAGLLQLLHDACSTYPGYRMHWKTTATTLVKVADRVTGAEVRRGGEREIVNGDYIVVSTGRGAGLRESAGLSTRLSLTAADVLWLRLDLSASPELLPDSVNVHMHGRGKVAVFFRSDGHHLHVALSSHDAVGDLRRNPAALRAELEPVLPATLREAVLSRLDDKTPSQLFRVVIDRLDTWHVPGALFIGDASHTMSPMAGQGLNVAVRDAIVAANHIIDAVRASRQLDDGVSAAIEAQREPEVDAMQAIQARVHRIVNAPKVIEHVMFTILKLVLGVRGNSAVVQGTVTVEPRYCVPIPEPRT